MRARTDVITFDYGTPETAFHQPTVWSSAFTRLEPPEGETPSPTANQPIRFMGREQVQTKPETPSGEDWLRGDLVICLDEAQRQAREFGVPWQAELVRYVVHGLLHLRGFDDRTTAARRAMKRAEGRVVRRLVARFSLSRLGSASRLAP